MKTFQAEVQVISINSDKFSEFAQVALKWLVNYREVSKKLGNKHLDSKKFILTIDI